MGSQATALAGMSSYSLNSVVQLRLQDCSFFLMLFLLCGAGLRWLWNGLAREFAILPRLSWKRGYALAGLLSLMLLLVLSMISGARELLTPGAWRRQGQSHRLNDPANESVRRQSLEALRSALFAYAKEHDGKFPPHDFVPEIPEKIWQSPDNTGTYYIYPGGMTLDSGGKLLAYEPSTLGEERLVLLVSGEIKKLTKPQIEVLLAGP